MKNCKICNIEFENNFLLSIHIKNIHKNLSIQDYYDKFLLKNNSDKYCPSCFLPNKFKGLTLGYSKHCSKKCTYINEEVKIKRKNTCLKKYGVENQLSSPEIKEKIKKTNIEKYGFDHHLKNKNILNKQKSTNLKKYGVDCILKSPKVKEKIKNTLIEKYGVDNIFKEKEIIKKLSFNKKTNFIKNYLNSEKLNNIALPMFGIEEYDGVKEKEYLWKCKKCNKLFNDNIDNGTLPRCIFCYPKMEKTSRTEDEVYEFCYNLTTVIKNTRNLISPLELDIYLPEHNLAIEFNGLFWHSESQGKYENYHLNKTNLCKEKGIELLHIFEDEWIYKKEIVKSIIKNKLKLNKNNINIKKSIIKTISEENCKDFLNKNQIEEYIKSDINIGLFYKKELICVLSAIRLKNNNYEITSICPKININLTQGIIKIFEFFKKEFLPKSIKLYSDIRYNNKVYNKLGLKIIGYQKPKYFFLKTKGLERYLKRYLEKDIKIKKEYDRIWDCGNYIYKIVL